MPACCKLRPVTPAEQWQAERRKSQTRNRRCPRGSERRAAISGASSAGPQLQLRALRRCASQFTSYTCNCLPRSKQYALFRAVLHKVRLPVKAQGVPGGAASQEGAQASGSAAAAEPADTGAAAPVAEEQHSCEPLLLHGRAGLQRKRQRRRSSSKAAAAKPAKRQRMAMVAGAPATELPRGRAAAEDEAPEHPFVAAAEAAAAVLARAVNAERLAAAAAADPVAMHCSVPEVEAVEESVARQLQQGKPARASSSPESAPVPARPASRQGSRPALGAPAADGARVPAAPGGAEALSAERRTDSGAQPAGAAAGAMPAAPATAPGSVPPPMSLSRLRSAARPGAEVDQLCGERSAGASHCLARPPASAAWSRRDLSASAAMIGKLLGAPARRGPAASGAPAPGAAAGDGAAARAAAAGADDDPLAGPGRPLGAPRLSGRPLQGLGGDGSGDAGARGSHAVTDAGEGARSPDQAAAPADARRQHAAVYGNYRRYYGYRVGRSFDEDPRLQVHPPCCDSRAC
jgi:hypothetical protein